jgi:hypothetical protein
VGDSAWRMVVTFDEAGDAESLAAHVEGRREISDVGGSMSFRSDGKSNSVYFYAPSREAIQQVAGVVRSVASRLGLAPTRVSGAEWLPEESRWSDEPGRAASGAGDAIAELVLGYFTMRP